MIQIATAMASAQMRTAEFNESILDLVEVDELVTFTPDVPSRLDGKTGSRTSSSQSYPIEFVVQDFDGGHQPGRSDMHSRYNSSKDRDMDQVEDLLPVAGHVL